MNEEALRMMVREAVRKHLNGPQAFSQAAPAGVHLHVGSHPSHFRYTLPGSGGACLIEPTVQCNHCGYCQSHGH